MIVAPQLWPPSFAGRARGCDSASAGAGERSGALRHLAEHGVERSRLALIRKMAVLGVAMRSRAVWISRCMSVVDAFEVEAKAECLQCAGSGAAADSSIAGQFSVDCLAKPYNKLAIPSFSHIYIPDKRVGSG